MFCVIKRVKQMNEKRDIPADRRDPVITKYGKQKSNESRIKLNIYGRQPVLEALRSGIPIDQVWLAEGLKGPSIQSILYFLKKNELPMKTIRKDALQKIVGAVVHQGVAAGVTINLIENDWALTNLLKDKPNPLLLVLDQVQDPHNFGAILRTAEISGVDAVIMPLKGSSDITATVAKTSAGALFYIPIYRCDDLLETFSLFKSMNIKLFATLPRTENSMYQVNLKQGCAILVGNEGQGVRKNLLPFCDEALYIPQRGRIQSLNASVSTAVVLYEALRQRHY